MMKISTIILTLIAAATLAASPVAAQSWLTGDVLGVDENTQSDEVLQETKSSRSNRETKTTTLRRNSFAELQELRELNAAERRAKAAELQALATEKRCEQIQANIQRRRDFYQNSNITHTDRFHGLISKAENAVARLNELGVDTTEVQLILDQIESAVAKLNSLHDKLISHLVAADELSCTENREAYVAELAAAQAVLADIRSQLEVLKKLATEDLVTALRQLKSTNRPDASSNSDNTDR